MAVIRERQLIHKGAKFDFERVLFSVDSGKTIAREIVRHPGAVVILPLLEGEGGVEVVMIRNRRLAVGAELWELPAGTLEAGEEPEACAARELEEETGYRASSLTSLGRFYTTPGMTDELMHAFLGTGLSPARQRLEEDEHIRVERVSIAEALGLIDEGRLMDAKSMLAILLAQRRGLLGD